jgi:hypothetical protein
MVSRASKGSQAEIAEPTEIAEISQKSAKLFAYIRKKLYLCTVKSAQISKTRTLYSANTMIILL